MIGRPSVFDTALHQTRIERVIQLAERSTQLHLDILGPVPAGAAGRAVWCHQATRLERHFDTNTGNDNTWRSLVNDLRDTPDLARTADRHIAIPHDRQVRPTDWAAITEHATATLHGTT